MNLLKKIFSPEIKEMNENERTMTVYASTGARDRMGEVLVPDGADLTQYRKNPVVLFAHDYSKPPIGKALWTKKDEKGILAKFQFAKTAFAEEIFNLYKDGFMKAFSVGFLPKTWVDGDGQKEPYRKFTKWEMLEFSAVPVPANPEALSLAMSKSVFAGVTLYKDEQEYEATFKAEVAATNPDGTPFEDYKAPDGEVAPTNPDGTPVEEEGKSSELCAELVEEVLILKAEVETLKKENGELTCALYKAMLPKKENKHLSGMADEDIVKMTNDTIVGVIRQIQGKV